MTYIRINKAVAVQLSGEKHLENVSFLEVSECNGGLRGRKTGGFTLLEILIVLFIAMLMLGMGIVGFAGRLPAAKLDATAREMSALMRQTRLLAKTGMEKQAFIVDMDARQYGIEGKTLRKIPDEVQVRVDDFMSGPRYQGSYRMIFSPFGGVDGGTIEMTAGRRSISLKADPILGVHINRKNQE